MQFVRCVCIALVALGLSILGSSASAQSTSLVSDASSAPGFWTNSESVTISGDGRWLAFESTAPLVTGVTGEHTYVHDRITAATELVSRASGTSGTAGNALSWLPSVSPDGRFVVYVSSATNLVPADTNGLDDVFLRDRLNQTTERVSLRHGGALQSAFGIPDTRPALSNDGRYVLFTSQATDLVAVTTTPNQDHVYVRDRATNSTILVSIDMSGGGPNGNCDDGDISGDGRYAAFDSFASDLVLNDTNARTDIFVRDLVANTTVRVSVSSAGAQANGESCCPAISNDGRYVAFESFATNLVAPNTAAGRLHVFRRDLQTNTTILLSTGFTGQGNDDSDEPRLSANGRYVAFGSWASNLVSGDNNGALDVFVRDCVANTTTRVSVANGAAPTGGAEANDLSGAPSISFDGSMLAFLSFATNLVASPIVPNDVINVYWRGPLLASAPVSFCTAGTTTNGCSATMSANAQPSVALASPCQIAVAGVEGQKTGIVFYALSTLPQPWCSTGGGTSYLCVKSPTMRSAPQSSGGGAGLCNGSLVLDWNAFQTSNPTALGAPWMVGERVFVQSWFRDPPACKTTSLSNALELIYLP
jgi:Tol biopolymer transport system component